MTQEGVIPLGDQHPTAPLPGRRSVAVQTGTVWHVNSFNDSIQQSMHSPFIAHDESNHYGDDLETI